MYDTLGFPIDLTQIMAGENGLEVDIQGAFLYAQTPCVSLLKPPYIQGFQQAMESQKSRGRQAMKDKRLAGRVALALGAEQTSYLYKSGVIPTGTASFALTNSYHTYRAARNVMS